MNPYKIKTALSTEQISDDCRSAGQENPRLLCNTLPCSQEPDT
jgi:hypothetical protein